MNKKIDYDFIIDSILIRCEEQSKYYETIAYNSDYKEDTIERIVNLGIAYRDVGQHLKLLINECLDRQSQVAKATRLGYPTTVGQAIADSNDNNPLADTRTENSNIVQPTVAQTDSK